MTNRDGPAFVASTHGARVPTLDQRLAEAGSALGVPTRLLQ